ncbi:CBS domain-containing protein [Iningainema tapete]|uniref:CBS domain-containing protein n=1 Tax=Iningainema tapete BLCC-T55 TaxID=2748662 RepID=A0A8J6XJS5_9CYAN|nr:CBS domain-containing protein [Iningainema tapete]MBD2772804.1 CBS domain-containing protein [Iningainema tapete BLCC-T55]
MSKTVADVMTRNPTVVKRETPLKEAIQILAQQHISGLSVVDDALQLIGIISETDLMWQETGVTPPAYIMFLDSVIYLQNPVTYDRDLHKALAQTVGELMSVNPVTTSPDKTITEAAKIIQEHKVHQLPVLDSAGQVVGMLTLSNIIQAMAASED